MIKQRNKFYLNNFFCRSLLMLMIAANLFSAISFAQVSITDSLEKKLKEVQGYEKINLLNKLSFLSQRYSIEKSKAYAKEAYDLSVENNFDYGKAEALNNLGFIFYHDNDLNSAEKNFLSAKKIFQEIKNKNGLARTLNYIGLINWRRNKFVEAFKYYREANSIATQINNLEISGEAINYMGLIYWKWSQYSKALDYFFKSLKIQEQIGNRFGIGLALNNIANIYNEMNQPDRAIPYSNRVLKIFNEEEDKYILGRAYNILGVSYFKKNDFDKAIFYQNESLRLKKVSGELGGMAFSYNDLGDIYFERKNYKSAIENYNEALRIRKQLNDKFGIASTLLSIAKVELANNNLTEAEKSLNESLLNASQIGNINLTAQAYKELSDLYYRKGNPSLALNYLKKNSELIDSIYNKEAKNKIAELTVIYDLDSKENELKIKNLEIEKEQSKNIFFILFGVVILAASVMLIYRNMKLRKTYKELDIKSQELQKAISSRDKFFSIMSHDLRSPFFGIKSMTEILSDPNEVITEAERKDFMIKLNRAVKDVYSLIENLIEWSKIQTNRIEYRPDNYDLYDDLTSILMMLSFNAEHKKIKIENKINTPIEVFADQQMVHSVLLNLITNAIKFTRENGLIEIFSSIENEFVKICVKDNGVGIPKEIKEKLFKSDSRISSRGTNQEKGTGLGLLLCKEFVEKNGGTLSFDTKEGEGTTFCFTLPKSKAQE